MNILKSYNNIGQVQILCHLSKRSPDFSKKCFCLYHIEYILILDIRNINPVKSYNKNASFFLYLLKSSMYRNFDIESNNSCQISLLKDLRKNSLLYNNKCLEHCKVL